MTANAHEPKRGRPDEVADRLQAEILRGKFRPGDRLPTERELAEQLCVNRSSVREGLKKLQQLGEAETLPLQQQCRNAAFLPNCCYYYLYLH